MDPISIGTRQTIFSTCGIYRYTLWREWNGGDGYVMFVGLNPSTADEKENDNTIRRCIAYAKDWGYSALCMTNLFAYRTVSPKIMKAALKPVGPENDQWLKEIASTADVIVAAWGASGGYMDRDKEVIALLPPMHYLKLTTRGFPGHPLYLLAALKPQLWHC